MRICSIFGAAALALTATAVTVSPVLAAQNKVALVLGVKGSPFYQAMQCGAQARAKALGLELAVSAPDQFAADSQIPVVDAVTATMPDAAVIVPTDMQALIQPMKQLHSRGSKVITVDQTLADTSFITTQVLTDNEAGGKLAADAMAKLLGGKGKVLTITQPPGSLAQDARAAGFKEELRKYPNITFLGEQYQSDDPQKAAEIVTSTLSAHSDLAGLFSTNDQGAIGAITGLRQAGAIGKVKVVAYDAAQAEVSALKNGTIQALIAQNPKAEGEAAMDAAVAAIAGKTLPKQTLTEIKVILSSEPTVADQYVYAASCE